MKMPPVILFFELSLVMESLPRTALAAQFVVVQYSFKIPLSLFALSDLVRLYSSRVVNPQHRMGFFARFHWILVLEIKIVT
ncbi:hypothetical protein DVH24_009019 [Malus domestica]|uniref:Secreted protein n=1 Tax=Malus domestica TaxID=3750 RepID=A0A498JN64_MALDO|nr:hypothetical protein DVH24_009019 [Malus domestica]